MTRSRIGASADLAAAEDFNTTLRRETLRSAKRRPGALAACLAVFRWITRYDTRRLYSALGYRSPIDYGHRSANRAISGSQPVSMSQGQAPSSY